MCHRDGTAGSSRLEAPARGYFQSSRGSTGGTGAAPKSIPVYSTPVPSSLPAPGKPGSDIKSFLSLVLPPHPEPG